MSPLKIVIASANSGKLKEFSELFKIFPIKFISQLEAGIKESIPETGTTFIENAIIKARFASQQTGYPAIADDSGVEVDILNGEPGVYSSCYSGKEGDFEHHIQKLLKKLEPFTKSLPSLPAARFRCTLVYLRHANDASPLIAQACWEGGILPSKQGKQGFGYDPVFYVPEFNCSAAELTYEQKNLLSHRGKAFKILYEQLKKEWFNCENGME